MSLHYHRRRLGPQDTALRIHSKAGWETVPLALSLAMLHSNSLCWALVNTRKQKHVGFTWSATKALLSMGGELCSLTPIWAQYSHLVNGDAV